MTGEITLRGRVLPIGGLKEKMLAAHRGGIKTVLIPKENAKDLREIPKKVREKLQIVLRRARGRGAPRGARPRAAGGVPEARARRGAPGVAGGAGAGLRGASRAPPGPVPGGRGAHPSGGAQIGGCPSAPCGSRPPSSSSPPAATSTRWTSRAPAPPRSPARRAASALPAGAIASFPVSIGRDALAAEGMDPNDVDSARARRAPARGDRRDEPRGVARRRGVLGRGAGAPARPRRAEERHRRPAGGHHRGGPRRARAWT